MLSLVKKIVNAKFAPRNFGGYTVGVAPLSGKNCGGVALALRETTLFRTENERVVGKNVILFKPVLG